MDKQKKIFVAGQTGFLGSSLTKVLVQHGYKNVLTPPRKELDLFDGKAVADFFKNNSLDYVFLCAAKVGGIKANKEYPADFIQQNLSIYNNVIHGALEHGVEKLLFLGSSCMYPYRAELPFKESDLFSGPLESTNHSFAVAKLAGYELCRSIYQQHNKSFITAIPTGLYGINDHFLDESSHVIPSLMSKFWKAQNSKEKEIKVWGSGGQKREFLFIDDCSEAIITIMNNYNDSEAINIGKGESVTIKELAYMIKEISNYSGEIVFDQNEPEGMPEKYLSSEKIESMNWSPKTSLHDGLQITWNWALENIFQK